MEICTTCNCVVKLNERIKEFSFKMFMCASCLCLQKFAFDFAMKPHLDAEEINLSVRERLTSSTRNWCRCQFGGRGREAPRIPKTKARCGASATDWWCVFVVVVWRNVDASPSTHNTNTLIRIENLRLLFSVPFNGFSVPILSMKSLRLRFVCLCGLCTRYCCRTKGESYSHHSTQQRLSCENICSALRFN